MKRKLFQSFSVGCLVGFGISKIIPLMTPDSKSHTPPTVSENSPSPNEKIIYQCPEDPADKTPSTPEYVDNLPPVLQTNHEGEVRVAWKQVPHAEQYQVFIKDLSGKKVRTWKTSKTALYLKELPFQDSLEFTPYKVTVIALNRKGLASSESAQHDLKVRRLNGVVAPSIRSIVIED
ncbi:hypothetical protein [Bdellovibrio svalbardensis]|uniref:Fibronectin type-III domain-containing protein n=1 Tax=Bdellovibrio svalbardensis TaxID=2972972 RepID=A0ABT6DH85_9BACT|nr:hypothetical protein [Bdellovibrio svalbardensis]MDG0816177.1 hypothetical protein [Bdellovibrio svalbardensis]